MVNMENYEEYMLLYADKELKPEQEQALLDFVAAHPELEAELEAYAATRLQPDDAMVFAEKETLIKTEPGGRTVWLGGWKAYAAAAGVILFVVLFSINRQSKEEVPPVIVKKETITVPVNTKPVENTSFDDRHQTSNTSAIAKSISPLGGKGEELHSRQPVNTVATKTTQSVIKKQPLVDEQVEQKIEHRTAPVPPVVKTEEVIVKSAEKESKELIAKANIPQEEVITVQQEPLQPAAQPVIRKNGFIAAVLGDKPAGLEKLEEEVNEKLTAARTLREQIKNTDAEVSFRIGKKELFTVRL